MVSSWNIKNIKIIVINYSSQMLFLYTKSILFQMYVDTCLFVNYIVERLSTFPLFSCVRIAQFLSLFVKVCRLLFFFLSFVFCPLHCLSIFEKWLLNTPLVSFKFFLDYNAYLSVTNALLYLMRNTIFLNLNEIQLFIQKL